MSTPTLPAPPGPHTLPLTHVFATTMSSFPSPFRSATARFEARFPPELKRRPCRKISLASTAAPALAWPRGNKNVRKARANIKDGGTRVHFTETSRKHICAQWTPEEKLRSKGKMERLRIVGHPCGSIPSLWSTPPGQIAPRMGGSARVIVCNPSLDCRDSAHSQKLAAEESVREQRP